MKLKEPTLRPALLTFESALPQVLLNRRPDQLAHAQSSQPVLLSKTWTQCNLYLSQFGACTFTGTYFINFGTMISPIEQRISDLVRKVAEEQDSGKLQDLILDLNLALDEAQEACSVSRLADALRSAA